MSIRRGHVPDVDRFTIIPNAWARDTRLSDAAVGLLTRLLSHREGWEISGVRDLARHSASGREAITTAVLELERFGYLKRERAHGEGGRFASTDYVLTGTPVPPDGPQPPPVQRQRRTRRPAQQGPAQDPQEPAETEGEDLAAHADGDGGGGELAPLPGMPGNGAGARDTGARFTGAREASHKEEHFVEDHLENFPPNPPQAGGTCSRHPQGPQEGRPCRGCGTDRASIRRTERLAASAAASAAAAARAASRVSLAAQRSIADHDRGADAVRAARRAAAS